MPELEFESIGSKRIAILVPSRHGDLTPVEFNRREAAKQEIRSRLSDLCQGATQEQPLTGTFKQGADYVDEPITRVFSVAPDSVIEDSHAKCEVISFTQALCAKLCQMCIGLEWGEELLFVYAKGKHKARRVPFNKLPKDLQESFAIVALRRLNGLRSISQLLALDAWEIEKRQNVAAPLPFLACAGIHGKKKAWISSETLDPQRRRLLAEKLRDQDLVFDWKEAGSLRIWMCLSGELRGGRMIPLAGDDGTITRSALVLTLSLLNASAADDLREVIDRSAVTAYFFREYRRLRDEIASHISQGGMRPEESSREAQRLLGQLMFVRFLEQKGVFEVPDYLRQRFLKSYYMKVLYPLFYKILDVPAAARKSPSNLPFLNGGLFHAPSRSRIDLPDALFDPDIEGSVLSVLYHFEFTLEEKAGAHEEVSVDPSMFGLVLESLSDPDQRKKKGIHYTPESIAAVLALESILRRLSRLADIPFKQLKDFYTQSNSEAITEAEADRILKALPTLRILDPAVGSGSLLLATLQVMMEIFRLCRRRNGERIQPGGRTWSTEARKYVRHCLFGLDIDADAVEIARLRLWLALAVEDEKAVRPLPDLTHNIRVADSLSEVCARSLGLPELEFSQLERARNLFRKALSDYYASDSLAARSAARMLEEAEKEYLIQELLAEGSPASERRAMDLRSGRPIPFFWHIHFGHVFEGPNAGFDIVIANPPYVRVQNLDRGQLQEHKHQFASMAVRNSDIYLAFIEQALRLSGRAGQIAFIMPSFARTQAGAPLRQILAQRGAVETWVDFGDIQVFPTASNYVALLFATAKKTRRKSFVCHVVRYFNHTDAQDLNWLDIAEKGTVLYKDVWGHLKSRCSPGQKPSKGGAKTVVEAPGIWRVASSKEGSGLLAMERKCLPLGDLAEIHIGIQTSRDEIFLLPEAGGEETDLLQVRSEHLDRDVWLEKPILKRCAKGSVHLKSYHLASSPLWCLWPYDAVGKLLEENKLKRDSPRAWEYFRSCENALREREHGRFSEGQWWRFRRPQGVQVSSKSGKILVPSTMDEATGVLDETGDITFTASGMGGGGAWAVTLRKGECRVDLPWLLAVLNSPSLWTWLRREGDPKRGGWRGVDQALLRRMPIPISNPRTYLRTAELIKQLIAALGSAEARNSAEDLKLEIAQIIGEAYRPRK